MSSTSVPLASLSAVSRPRGEERARQRGRRRLLVWVGGALIGLALYVGIPAFWSWKHPISSSGGRYFVQQVIIPVPIFEQGDPRWTFDLLGPTIDTMGQAGCAVTSAAMVLSAYGVDTDPQRLNQYLTLHGGYTDEGWLYWEKAAEVAPGGQVEKVYEDPPSYALLDQNLLAGNPMIVRLTLRNGHTHFVVVVGKAGWDYLIQDPARGAAWGVYPLKELTDQVEALRFYRVVPAHTPATALMIATPGP
jgi:hypothetical protein